MFQAELSPIAYDIGCKKVEDLIDLWYTDDNYDDWPILLALQDEIMEGLKVILPVTFMEENDNLGPNEVGFDPLHLTSKNGKKYIAVFTNAEELQKGEECSSVAYPLREVLTFVINYNKVDGIVINPWGNLYMLDAPACRNLYKNTRKRTEADEYLQKGSDAYLAKDYPTALEYYTKAAELGSVEALGNLGYCYYYRTNPVDKRKAAECWQKASEQGDVCSTYKLGDLYRRGELGEPDLNHAKALYHVAYNLSKEYMNYYEFPDAYLRILKYAREGFTDEELLNMAYDCVDALQTRIHDGDQLSDAVLKDAQEQLHELQTRLEPMES